MSETEPQKSSAATEPAPPYNSAAILRNRDFVLYLTSRLIKEIAKNGGETRSYVPKYVHRRLAERFAWVT